MSKQARSLIVALLVPQAFAAVGAVATASSVTSWYRSLRKPSWNPPDWLFGPVWTVLYAMMGVASWLVWQRRREDRRAGGALTVYGAQLALNALWSVLFFGARRVGWALAELTLLWALIAATIVRFYRIRPLAAALLLPYQLWSTFAAALNAAIWRLNR